MRFYLGCADRVVEEKSAVEKVVSYQVIRACEIDVTLQEFGEDEGTAPRVSVLSPPVVPESLPISERSGQTELVMLLGSQVWIRNRNVVERLLSATLRTT